MRHFFSILLFVGCVLTTQAQNSTAAKNRVAEIKNMYSEVKKMKEYRKEAELPPDEMVITNEYMAAGAGPIKEVYHYYYSGDFNEDLGADFYELHFVTRSYNVGAINHYEEYLYDKKGLLAFYFEKIESNETRYYFDNGKLIHSIIKGEESQWREIDSDLLMLHRYAADTQNAFNLLMNRNY